ncbi:MAG: GNAT family N-acetyltransferase [candidate division WOR-3 bacterium]
MGLTELPVIGPIAAFLRRTFVKEPPFTWRPGRIGPRFQWLDHDHIRILSGPLKDQVLEIVTEIKDKTASVFASIDGKRIGRTYIERNPPGVGVELWDIAVQEAYRRKGIASIMTYIIFRELLSIQERAVFKIRMMRLMKPSDKNIELQNVGIGVIGNRLGFTPEFDIERILRPANIVGITVLPAKGGFPPSFKIVIRTFPLVLIAFVLDTDTLRPVEDFRTYVQLTKDETVIYDWVRRGLIVIGNGNYRLRKAGVEQFVNHLATDEFEARVFRRRVRGL